MTETIILAPGAGETEILRMLARHEKNTFNHRVMNGTQLALYALTKCGIVLEKPCISANEETAVYSGILTEHTQRDDAYFVTASYSDARKFAAAMNSVRRLITGDERIEFRKTICKNKAFQRKNKALSDIFEKYLEETAEKTDTIEIIRTAIEKKASFSADFIVLDEYPLSPVEEKLIETVSGGKYEKKSICDLLGKQSAGYNIEEISKAYGAVNEVRHILKRITEEHIPLDNCVVAVTDGALYSQIFYDECIKNNVPVCFGCGIPISNSYPAQFLKLLNYWDTDGLNGIDALRNLVFSPSFDYMKLKETLELDVHINHKGESENRAVNIHDVIEFAGNLRLSRIKTDTTGNDDGNDIKLQKFEKSIAVGTDDNDRKKDRALAEIGRKLAAEFEQGYLHLIHTYCRIRNVHTTAGRVDRSALKLISDELATYIEYKGDSNLSEIADEIPGLTVCTETSKEGALFVTTVDRALSSLRKVLFVAGLSAENFPGKPRENYIILDDDYILFDKENSPTSDNIINSNKNRMSDLLSVASAIGNRIILSYPYFNLSQLKQINCSPVLSDYTDKTPTETDFVVFGKTTPVTEYETTDDGEEEQNDTTVTKSEFTVSATDIEKFVSCNRQFYFSKILGIKSEKEDDPVSVIGYDKLGTLIHSLMETAGNRRKADNPFTEDEFVAAGEAAFDAFLCRRPPVDKEAARIQKKTLIDMLKYAYSTDTNKVHECEKYMTVLHEESGLTISGTADRIEETDDGKCIGDYKTGNHIKHDKSKPETLIQAYLYAWMTEKLTGEKPATCEFRYLRKRVPVKCSYDKDAETMVTDTLNSIATCIKDGVFNKVDKPGKNNDVCKYCDYYEICTKNEEGDDN